MTTILSVQSSARYEGSHSRALSAKLVEKLVSVHPGAEVIERDVARDVPLVSEDWLGANWTPEDDRSDEQKQVLALSDTLIEELERSDVIVIGAPMYNFAIAGALKAWIDQIARAGRTFRYTENGPVGLLEGKKAYVVLTSGGVPVDSPYDFLTGYMRHVLGFVGITDVDFVAADQLMQKEEESLQAANDKIEKVAA